MMTTNSHTYDLLSPDCLSNPYPTFARMRAQTPVYWSQQLQSWVVTRYDDIVTALHAPCLSVSRFATPPPGVVSEPVRQKLALIFDFLSHWLVALDPPEHTIWRTWLNKAFTPHRVKRLRPRIQKIADELISDVVSQGHMDVVDDFAGPLPVHVIAEILGVPLEERAQMRRWSGCIVQFGGQGGGRAVDAMHQSVQEMMRYFRSLIHERRQVPGNDFISELLAENFLDPATEAQMLANFAFLLFVGHETTTHAIKSGVFTWLRLKQICPELAATPTAVEEVLRFDTAVPHVVRVATDDFVLNRQHIKAGQMLTLFLAAANRDPDHFPLPDKFDACRLNNRHLSFGHGIHYCLGAPLARVEIVVALKTLFGRLPTLQFTREFQTQYGTDAIFRGASLPVVF